MLKFGGFIGHAKLTYSSFANSVSIEGPGYLVHFAVVRTKTCGLKCVIEIYSIEDV